MSENTEKTPSKKDLILTEILILKEKIEKEIPDNIILLAIANSLKEVANVLNKYGSLEIAMLAGAGAGVATPLSQNKKINAAFS